VLKRENFELRRANEILKAASVLFATEWNYTVIPTVKIRRDSLMPTVDRTGSGGLVAGSATKEERHRPDACFSV